MTDEEFMAKVMDLSLDIPGLIMAKAKDFVAQEIVDTEDYPDNYHLPKIFMQYVGMEISRQYSGSQRDRSIANTIYHRIKRS